MKNEQGIKIADVPARKYIITSRRFDGVKASGVPCVGQVATNSKLLAYILYNRWNKFASRYLFRDDNNYGYTIAVMLFKRNKEGLYSCIKR